MTTNRVVLIVEDEMMIALDLQVQLEEAGWDVIGPAATIEEARSMLEHSRPNAAVLDVNLSGDTSFQLAEALTSRGTRVVFLTGKTRNSLPENMRDYDVLQKPLRRNELARLLNGPA